MKKLLMLAAAAAAILPMTAQADPTANGQVTVHTKVEDTCAISGLSSFSGLGDVYEPFNNTAGGVFSGANAKVKFESGELVDPTTARAKSETQVLKLTAFCNHINHTVALQSQNGGLTTSSNPNSNGDFHRRIAYAAKISNWGGASADLAAFNTGGTLTTGVATISGGSSVVSLPSHSNTAKAALLTIQTAASTVPLVQGNYEDVLKIRLGAGF